MAQRSQQRVPTGIRGLDAIIDGGFQQGCVYVVRGEPGAGKTILANHICFNLAARGAVCTYVSVLTEASERMVAQQSTFEFFRPELVGTKVTYVSAYRVLQESGLAKVLELLRTTMSKRPGLLVLDGLQTLREYAPDEGTIKRFVHDLQAIAMVMQSTVVLLCGLDPRIEVEPEHTVVDGIIELTNELTDMRALRHVHVPKMRGANQIRGRHTLVISDAGITITPRAETRRRDEEIPSPDPSTRMGFDIERLDRMLGGGLPAQSITMLVGPTGSGKTILGLRYLVAGAAAGEPALHFGFYERPRELVEKAGRVGTPIGDLVGSGALRLVWQSPVEGVRDVLVERLLADVEKYRIRRLLIDGIHTFGRTIDYPDRLPDALSALQTELQKMRVTTIYTLESPTTFAMDMNIPIRDVSATSHNIIMLRLVEADAQMHRLISVMKVRDCQHDMRAYEFAITDHGLSIQDAPDSAVRVLSRKGRDEP